MKTVKKCYIDRDFLNLFREDKNAKTIVAGILCKIL